VRQLPQFSFWIENFIIHKLMLPEVLAKFTPLEMARDWVKRSKVAFALPHANSHRRQ
jgi:hypothetical protein